MGSPELAGLRILITRPAQQADSLCQRITQRGGTCIKFPLLAILPPRDPIKAAEPFKALSRYHGIIFISANAVTHGWPYLQAHGGLPATCRIITVGKATAEVVRRCGGRVDLMPTEDFSSEGVLALPAIQQVVGQRFLIVRGEGGKETLATTLRSRGAEVVYAEVYRRDAPPLNFAVIIGPQEQPLVDVITISSAEALQHLAQQAKAQQINWVFQLPLIVVHARQIELARQLGFTLTPSVADNASDEAVVAALLRSRENKT